MDIKLTQPIINEASKKIAERINSPTHNLESTLDSYSKLVKDSSLKQSLQNLTESFSVLEILVSKLTQSRTFNVEFNNTYAAYVAAEYGLMKLNGNSSSKGGTKAINPYRFGEINFSEIYPGPREAMLSTFGKSIGRLNGLGLTGHLDLFYSWVKETSLSMSVRFTQEYGELVKQLKVKINDDFEINGFFKPIAVYKPTKNGPKWEDFGGYEEIIDYFKGLTDVLKRYDYVMKLGTLRKKEALPKLTLLYGPPGTGKTTLARIFCNEADVPFIMMGSADIADRYQFGPTILLQEKFDEAARTIKEGGYKASVLFMDEIDSYLGVRTSNNKEDSKVVSTFNEYMAGTKETDGVIVIGATNNIEQLDRAVYSRFKQNMFYIDLPSQETAKKIFNVHLKGRQTKINENDVDYLITKYDNNGSGTPIFSGRDIEHIISRTYRNKTLSHLKSGGEYIPTKNDFIKEIEAYKLSGAGHENHR